jgi:hypothetical protein
MAGPLGFGCASNELSFDGLRAHQDRRSCSQAGNPARLGLLFEPLGRDAKARCHAPDGDESSRFHKSEDIAHWKPLAGTKR